MMEGSALMRDEMIRTLEAFLEGNDFGKNWDGAYQDAVPALRQYFHKEGFQTTILNEWDSESRETELIATRETLVVRILWAEDYHGKSLVDLQSLQIDTRPLRQSASAY
jgi:hypothetical protein